MDSAEELTTTGNSLSHSQKPKLTKKEKIQKYGEVFTPAWVVNQMIDQIYQDNPQMANDISSTWLEPSCGEGAFLSEILRRKLARCHNKEDICTALNALFGVEIQPDNTENCKNLLFQIASVPFGTDERYKLILDRNIVCGDFLTGMGNDGKPIWFLLKEELALTNERD